jgi:chromosome partitioning protein
VSIFEYLGVSPANIKEFIAAIGGVLGFGLMAFSVGRRFGNGHDGQKIAELLDQNKALCAKLVEYELRSDELEVMVGNAQEFWSRAPKQPFDATLHRGQICGSIPIISIVNFKAGVGKTTICANLAGYFARSGKRVLLIDFDYQGSLSDTVLSHARIEDVTATSQKLIDNHYSPDQLRGAAERLTSLSSNLWIYSAFYGFSRSEIQMMFRWLVGKDAEIRYNLHYYLQSPPFQSAPETSFDLVLIDCPPRLLTGSVNALAASTHVLVPTILDGQSHVATLNTLGAIQQFRQSLNKNLKTIGIVPSLVSTSAGYNERELQFINELERQITTFHDPIPVLKERPIIKKEQLARAGGSEVIYLSASNDKITREMRSMFANLANYIEQQISWRQPDAARVIALPGAHDEDRRIASRS